MKEPHFHEIAKICSVSLMKEIVVDSKFLDTLKKFGVKINGINNYGSDTGKVVINLLIPSGKDSLVHDVIIERHNYFVKYLEDKF